MPRPPDPDAPESILLQAFGGLKNTVTSERLGVGDLERATNIDLDDAGQAHRRRGYAKVALGSWRSVRFIGGKLFGVVDNQLAVVRDDYSYEILHPNVTSQLCFTEVAGDVYFSGGVAGVIAADETISPWGVEDGQGRWLSPVVRPTQTLGAISGKLLGPPPIASLIEAYNGRIYLAVDNVLWATEMFAYHYVDKTKNFIQFESEITLLMALGDGLVVGTVDKLYFLKGEGLGKFKLETLVDSPALRGSGVRVPADLVHPNARNGPMPASEAVMLLTNAGIVAVFDGGSTYNLTHDRVIFPAGQSAAALYRHDLGVSSYVAAVDSSGGPSANTRIGDFVDAEIVRAADRLGG